MKNKILSLAILSSLSLIFSVSCGSDVQAPSGALPTWNVGDTWTSEGSMSGYEYRLIQTVTGEQVYNGVDCYTVDGQITMQGTSTTAELTLIVTSAFDKTTLIAVGAEQSLPNGIGPTTITNESCNYSVSPYPLSVGKTWTVTKNDTILDYSTGNITTAIGTYIYNVESIESITVPAGTFQCYKIVWNDSNNSSVITEWVTDITKGIQVKTIGNVFGTTIETVLVSYSVSE